MLVKVYAPYCPWPISATPMSEAGQPVAEEGYHWQEGDEPQDCQTRKLHQQLELIRLLNQINTQIGSTLDLDEVLNSACRSLGSVLKCSRVSILVKESEEAQTLTTRAEYNLGDYPPQLGLKVPIEEHIHLQVVMSQVGTVAMSQFLNLPGLSEKSREVAKSLGIRSMLAIATRYQGKVNGAIGLHQCDRERVWTEWEKQLVEGVAHQLAIAINQAQMYSETRKQAERESLLHLVINQIRSTLDLNTVLQTAVEGIRKLLDTDRVVIYQFQENWRGIVVVEDIIHPWQSVLGDMGADDCFSGEYAELYQEGRIRAIDNIQEAGLDRCHVKFLQRLQIQANLIVPIIIGEKLWGLLIAHECRGPRQWQSSETELLRQLGDQIAIAISQAELYAQVQDAAAKSQAQAQQLQATLEELRATQQQLIQSEKLSSLGQMVAGIAHEINNANNFIYANLSYARDYADGLRQALDLYKKLFPEPLDPIVALDDELELDYIREDFPKVIKSMEQGSERIRGIMLTLRNFSRLDEAESKCVDLNEGIESSLAMLQHRLKRGIKIQKEYGTLPKIECRASQINQVFFNLIHNALDAVEAIAEAGELTIRTWQSAPDWVTISIRDNGDGIDPKIQNKIFDPFFTTKPVGKGTGLGLSLCYQVVVKGHGGRLKCISSHGNGAEFVVELPV